MMPWLQRHQRSREVFKGRIDGKAERNHGVVKHEPHTTFSRLGTLKEPHQALPNPAIARTPKAT